MPNMRLNRAVETNETVPLISLRACYIILESNEITSFLSYLPTVAFIASFYSFILAPPGRDAGQIFLEGKIKGCAMAASY